MMTYQLFFGGGETIQHIYKDIMKRCARVKDLFPLCVESDDIPE